MGTLSVSDALKLLHQSGIKVTKASLRHWLREGHIEGTAPPTRQPAKGWTVSEDSLHAYILERQKSMQSVQEDLSKSQEHGSSSLTCDLPSLVREESQRLGITYHHVVDTLLVQILEHKTQDEFIRFCIRELLKQSLRQFIEESTQEHTPIDYSTYTIPDLIRRVVELRRLWDGTPERGQATLEYEQIRGVLEEKGIPISTLGM